MPVCQSGVEGGEGVVLFLLLFYIFFFKSFFYHTSDINRADFKLTVSLCKVSTGLVAYQC